MVKGRKSNNTKAPSPCRQNWVLCVPNLCQNVTLHGSTKLKPYLLPFEELDIGNDHLSIDSGYDNRSCINYPFYCALNQVDLSTDLLDKLILTKVVIQPTEKTRSVLRKSSTTYNTLDILWTPSTHQTRWLLV